MGPRLKIFLLIILLFLDIQFQEEVSSLAAYYFGMYGKCYRKLIWAVTLPVFSFLLGFRAFGP